MATANLSPETKSTRANNRKCTAWVWFFWGIPCPSMVVRLERATRRGILWTDSLAFGPTSTLEPCIQMKKRRNLYMLESEKKIDKNRIDQFGHCSLSLLLTTLHPKESGIFFYLSKRKKRWFFDSSNKIQKSL